MPHEPESFNEYWFVWHEPGYPGFLTQDHSILNVSTAPVRGLTKRNCLINIDKMFVRVTRTKAGDIMFVRVTRTRLS